MTADVTMTLHPTEAEATLSEAEAKVNAGNENGDGAATKAGTNMPANKVQFDTNQLAMYYARLYPYEFMYDWLSYHVPSASATIQDKKNTPSRNSSANNACNVFPKREWSFTLNVRGEEIYMRYQSFLNAEEFSAAVRKRNPHKIDIGAVFSHPPKDHKTIKNFTTVQRELVFDIDLTDYDPVRTCCSGANICRKCWKFMNMAVKVMDVGLKEDFGFEHVYWFYSGRRGVHAWISDEAARMLSNEARSAVAHYFEVECESAQNKEGLKLHAPIHPMLARAYSILEPMFVDSIIPEKEGQGLLANEENWMKVLNSLPSGGQIIRTNLAEKWNNNSNESLTPSEKWEDLKRQIGIVVGKGKSNKGKGAQYLKGDERERLEMWPYETVFKYTYPRLDINVSTHQNHLLKSPFCIHPKTGRVCVPIQVDKIDSFDPFSVPTLPQILSELDEYEKKQNDGAGGDENKVRDWQKTSLRNSFSHFHKQLKHLQSTLRRKERDSRDAEDALLGDF